MTNFADLNPPRTQQRGGGGAFAVTPADGTDLANKPAYLWVGGAGNVSVLIGGQVVVFNSVAAGTRLDISPERVRSTGTSASNIVAVY